MKCGVENISTTGKSGGSGVPYSHRRGHLAAATNEEIAHVAYLSSCTEVSKSANAWPLLAPSTLVLRSLRSVSTNVDPPFARWPSLTSILQV